MWPATAAIAAAASHQGPASRARAATTAALPFAASSSRARRAAHLPDARSTFVAPALRLPIVRTSMPR